MRVAMTLLLCSCAFNAPSQPGAYEACIDWVVAGRNRGVACGRDLAKSDAQLERVMKQCDNVIAYDRDRVYGWCIPTVTAAACPDVHKVDCDGFTRLDL